MPIPLLALLALGGAGVLGGAAALGASRRANGTARPLEEGDMPDDEGAFTSAMRFIGRPGKVINNLAMGNLEGAARQTGDIFGDAVDAFIPGNVIPSLSRKQDYPEFSDVAGGMEPGFGKTAVDILGGMVTDPINLLPIGWGGTAAKALGSTATKVGAKVAPELTKSAVEAAGGLAHKVRAATANLNLSDEVGKITGEAAGLGNATAKAAQGFAVPAFQGVAPDIMEKTAGIIRGVAKDDDVYRALDKAGEASIPFVTKADQMARIEQRLANAPWDEATKQAVREMANKVTDYTRGLYQQATKDAVLERPNLWHSPEGQILAQDVLKGEFEKVAADAQRVLDSKVASLEEKIAARDAKASALKPVNDLIDRRAGDVLGAMPPEGAFNPRAVGRAEGFNEIGSSVEGRLGTVQSQADALRQELEMAKLAQKAKQGVPASLEDYAKSKGIIRKPIGEDLVPADYLPGKYDVDPKLAESMGMSGAPNLIKAKSLKNPEELAGFLNETGAKMETDLPAILGDYGSQLGRATQSASIGKKLAKDSFTAMSDPASRKAVTEAIDALRSAGKLDDALALEVGFSGLPPREGFFKLMAGLNGLFKPAATGGAFIPKPGFNVRNAISGAAQIGQESGLEAGLSAAARTPKALAGAWADGLRSVGVPLPGEPRIAQIEEAIRLSGGNREKMLEAISDPVVRQAVKHGVIDNGFVSSEQMAEKLANAGPKNWRTWRDWPSVITQGLEQRMRLGRFEELLGKNISEEAAAKAAKTTADNLYDYAYSSVMNRNLRDVIPFAQYSFKAIPQSAKFLTSGTTLANAALSGLSHAYGATDDNQVYPWMEGRFNIPVGGNDQGQNNYISGLGLPFESLSQVPNLSGSPRSIGRELERNIVASTQPVLKTGYGMVSGHDPFSQQPFMGYDKLPVVGSAGGVGRAYNAASGTGLIQPITSPLSVLDKLADERRGPGLRAIDVLTGANVVSVDPDRATQLNIAQELENNPQVRQYRSVYSSERDPEIMAKIMAMKDAGRRAKQRAKEQALAALESGNVPDELARQQEKIRAKKGRDKHGNIVGLKESK